MIAESTFLMVLSHLCSYTIPFKDNNLTTIQLCPEALERPYPADITYCLQWLLPVLFIPKSLHLALWFSHSMFMGFYLLSFLLERKPCTICALVFLFLICYSCWGNCFLYHCSDSLLPESAHVPGVVGT
ncbi:bladder cancer-associated protein-like [Suncus etruscus]|uniref:bladder cancer-associated protein-like n=1 Tax=Suncus etruscus TaxID=109475 RepID=UPI00210F6509|nr:bladder cancer-associated protein-like [Suncus etruscus]